MENEQLYIKQKMLEHKAEIEPLLRYLPWLEEHTGKVASQNFTGEGVAVSSVPFPVYDSVLMAFVREASAGSLMDRNYPYVFTRGNIRTHEDERRVIRDAQWRDWEVLCGILSKYCLGGRTKSTLWSEAVTEGIFALCIGKMKELVDYWCK